MADASDRLIVPLDVTGRAAAEAMVERLGEAVTVYKIGYQLAFSDGLGLVRDLKAAGKRVFLDLKLLDIDNTVEKGVESIAATGADMLTVHAYPKAMAAAVRGAQGSGLTLLGVSVLTSMDDEDLFEAGYGVIATMLVEKRAHQAVSAGIGGLVCSPGEAQMVRRILGPDRAVVTPGIRPEGSAKDDQKRVAAPAEALARGASHLVVGRPITAADDPAAAARSVLAEMEEALAEA